MIRPTPSASPTRRTTPNSQKPWRRGGFDSPRRSAIFSSRPEVARRWFGEEFLPVVRMARRAGIRADIDSDAELYLWLAGERYRLFRRHIWDDAVFEQLSDAARRYRR